ncbi:hypothetical protein NDI49_32550, partial [Trichocoleus sp. ST-U3]
MSNQKPFIPKLILPVGTQVVTRVEVIASGELVHPSGAVGVIVQAPVDYSHSYRVQLPDGAVVSLRREELTTRKQWQQESLQPALGLGDDLSLY